MKFTNLLIAAMMLGVHFDNRLAFDYYTSGLCKRTSKKINALARVNNTWTIRKILMNAFFDSQFKYCSLIWMFHSHTDKRQFDRLHERCLKIFITINSHQLRSYLKKTALYIHERNFKILATEVYKVSNNVSPPHERKF